MRQYRQGDVFIFEATTVPGVEISKDNDRTVLAYGEVTGHAHVFRDPGVCLLQAEGITDRVLTLAKSAFLMHEEHTPIEIGAGAYRVRIQREYNETAMARLVED